MRQSAELFMQKLNRLPQNSLPFIHLVNPLSLVAVRDRVQDVKFSALGGHFGIFTNSELQKNSLISQSQRT